MRATGSDRDWDNRSSNCWSSSVRFSLARVLVKGMASDHQHMAGCQYSPLPIVLQYYLGIDLLAKLATRPQLRSQRDTVFLTFSFNRLRGMPTR